MLNPPVGVFYQLWVHIIQFASGFRGYGHKCKMCSVLGGYIELANGNGKLMKLLQFFILLLFHLHNIPL